MTMLGNVLTSEDTGVGGGGATAPPTSFDLVKIWAKSLKIRANLWKFGKKCVKTFATLLYVV